MKLKKILISIIIALIFISNSMVNATFSIEKADLYSKGRCKTLLKLATNGGNIIVARVFYTNNGKEYPAYCMNVELKGIGDSGGYAVTINEAVSNPKVWRAITNGYPYKSLAELGVADEDEAYTATKQAVYCVLYDYDLSRYLPVGEAGERTLNAMKQIVEATRNGTATKPSNIVQIQEVDDWQVEEDYIVKKFKATTECNCKEIYLNLDDTKENQIKIVNENNQEISSVMRNEEFKVMMPIKLLEKDGEITITAKAELETKPVLYGKCGDSTHQNYALAGEIYEGGSGSKTINYTQNKTKLKIVKKDNTEDKVLEGVEFNILNENGEIEYSNLKTDSNGEIVIENMIPGKYYLKEINTKDGYIKLQENIEFEVKLNEELLITVTNKKEEITPKKEQTYSEKLTKLPVTGM